LCLESEPFSTAGQARVLFPQCGKAEARREPMSNHKFKIGQLVNYKPRVKSLGAGVYMIAQLMPPTGDEPQYRIKSEREAHLRSAMES
jgi:hypothetical protein